MSTESDLREAYQRLVDTALPKETLVLSSTGDRVPARRGAVWQVALTVGAVIAVISTALVIARPWHRGSTAPSVPAPGRPINYPAEYWFGKSSLPGYVLTDLSLSPTGQQFAYKPAHPANGAPERVSLAAFAPTAADRAAVAGLERVAVGHRTGYYGSLAKVASAQTQTPGLLWPLSSTRWVALSAPATDPSRSAVPKPKLVQLAATVTSRVDPHVAQVEVGWLPRSLRFDYAAQYVDRGTMLSPDGTTGTGYRTLSFIDRSVRDDRHSTLDIVSVIDPAVPLDKAKPDQLPGFDNGPWTKTTVRGHLAYVAPHDVLIQWGNVQIGVASTRITGDTSTPLLSKAELLKVANSLTVPSSVDIGQGYPLTTAIPPTAVR